MSDRCLHWIATVAEGVVLFVAILAIVYVLFALAGCGGSKLPAPSEPRRLEPVQFRACLKVWTSHGTPVQVCSPSIEHCRWIYAGAVEFGGYAGLAAIGECAEQ